MLADPPFTTPIVDPKSWLMPRAWFTWVATLVAALNATPGIVGSVSLTEQDSAIAATDIKIQPVEQVLPAGLYRVSYSARISRAGTVSSSLTPTFRWTCGGVAQSQSGAAMTGNTTTTQQNGVLIIRCDASTAIRYETAYATAGATSMQYQLDIQVERLNG